MVATVKKRRGIPVPLHRRQLEFVQSNALKKGYVGGRGAGKSFILMYDMIKKAKNGRLYMIAAPTYPMLSDSSFRSFINVAENVMGGRLIRAKHGSDLWCNVRTFDPHAIPSSGSAEFIFRTASDPEKLRGPNMSGIGLDEASLMIKEALDISMACLREGGDIGTIAMAFTPKGKQHWTYSEFFQPDGTPQPYSEVFHSHQRENVYLHKMYMEMMEAQYGKGSRMAGQELEGRFVDIEGLMFQRQWFKVVEYVPENARRIRYWDKASTDGGGCFSVGALVAKSEVTAQQFIVEDIVRGQWSYAKRNEIIKLTAQRDLEKYGNLVTTWIEQEPGSGGQESALISVKDLAGHAVYLDRAQSGKVERSVALASQSEIGNVAILRADWNDGWLEEIQAFPESNFKDQVDATTGAFNKLALGGFRISTAEGMLSYPLSAEKQAQENERVRIQQIAKNLASEDGNGNNARPHDRTGETSRLLEFLTRNKRKTWR